MTGLATVSRVDACQKIGVGMANHTAVKCRNNASSEMVKAVLCRLLFIQMAGQAVSWIGSRSNNIGDRPYRHLAVALVVNDFTICPMADNAVTSLVQDKDLTPSIKNPCPGIRTILSVTGTAGLVG